MTYAEYLAEATEPANVVPFQRQCGAALPGDKESHAGRLFQWEGARLCRECWRLAFDRWTPPEREGVNAFQFFSRLRSY